MKRLIPLFMAIMLVVDVNASTPEEVLQSYFNVLTQRDFSNMHSLLAETDLKEMKTLLDHRIREGAKAGNYRLQHRLFGKRLPNEQLAHVTTKDYVNGLAREVLRAANSVDFSVAQHRILGQIAEGDDTIHLLARLELQQSDKSMTDVFLYTVVKESDEWKLKFPETFRQILTVIESSGAGRE